MFIAHTGYLELFDLVVKHILPGMGLFFYFVLHFNCKFAPKKRGLVFLIGNQNRQLIRNSDDYDIKWVSG